VLLYSGDGQVTTSRKLFLEQQTGLFYMYNINEYVNQQLIIAMPMHLKIIIDATNNIILTQSNERVECVAG